MNKIEFKNKGEVDATSINADNLNLLQDNAEKSINEINDLLNSMKTVNLSGVWMNVGTAQGSGLRILLPIFNPSNRIPKIEFTSAKLFDNTFVWYELNLATFSIHKYGTNFVTIHFENPSASLTVGMSYLVSLTGTIVCE